MKRAEASNADASPDARMRYCDSPHELDALIARATSGDEQAVRVAVQAWLESASPESANESPPARIDRFEILNELGRGGYGIVYLAIDSKLDRVVALKVPRPEIIACESLRWRVQREALAAASVNHPNALAVYEVGNCGSRCWIAQEYCRGPSLDQWLEKNGRAKSVAQAAEMVASLAEAVAHAHRRGVVHRDLKPSNVMLEPRSPRRLGDLSESPSASLEEFIPKLTDFGLAKVVERPDSPVSTSTVMGTPRYTAPEMIDSDLGAIGDAADIYGLGALLYEVWTGAPIFSGTSPADTLRRVLTTSPIPARRLRPDTPRDLEAILERCLEKEPLKRYASADELAADLRRLSRGEPTRARPLSTLERGVKWCRREPAWATVLGLCILIPCVLTAITLYYVARLGAALETSEQIRAQLRQQVYPDLISHAWRALANGDSRTAESILLSYTCADGFEDLRGFEWRYLMRNCLPPHVELAGHREDVYCATFSRDGALVATAGKDGTARIWNSADGVLVRALEGHGGEVDSVAFSPDMQRIATACDDGHLRVWSVATGKLERTFSDHAAAVTAVAFSNDGRWLISAGKDDAVRVWDANSWTPRATLTGHTAHIDSLSVAADSSCVITGSDDQTVRKWCLRTFREVGQVARSEIRGFAQGVAISPSGQRFVSGGVDGLVRAWWLEEKSIHWKRRRHNRQIETVAWSPDDKMIASGGHDGQIVVSVADEISRVSSIQAHQGRIWCVAFDADSRRIVSAGADGVARVWNIDDAGCRAVQGIRGNLALPFSTSASGERIAAHVGGGNAIEVRDVGQEKPIAILDVPRGSSKDGVALSPAGDVVAVGTNDGRVVAYRVADQCLIAEVKIPSGRAAEMRYSADGTRLVARVEGGDAASDGRRPQFVVWNAFSLSEVFRVDDRPVAKFDLSHDGNWLATLLDDGSLAVWNVEARRLQGRTEGSSLPPHAVAFSPDGRSLVTAGDEGALRIWSTDTMSSTVLANVSMRAPVSLAFSPDGKTLAYSHGVTFDLYHVASGQQMLSMRGARGRDPRVVDARFTADGNAFVVWCAGATGHAERCVYRAD